MSHSFDIAPDDLTGEDVRDLLALHLAEMYQWSPACKVNSLPAERLQEDDVMFYAARLNGRLAAIGALKALGGRRGELKAMRASPEFRGQGAGKAILNALLDEARKRGYEWVGLETGRTDGFAAATALYRKHGFAECAAFGDYTSDDFSMCMELTL